MEILHNGEWGTICNDKFEDNNNGADILCRMMGYVSEKYSKSYRQGVPKSQKIWLDDVRCTGSESHIKDCDHNEWGVKNCHHSEDVAIKCVTKGEQLFI